MTLLFASITLAMASDLEVRAQELARLRAEVEELQDDVAQEKDALRASTRALEAELVEVSAEIRREELHRQQVEQDLEKQRQALGEAATVATELRPTVEASIALLRAAVEQGLPYRQEERLAALAALDEEVRRGSLDSVQAASRLWAFAEDELRLGRETALDRQVLALDGQDRLVEVARVGMMALYFRTDDGRVGQVVRGANGWDAQVLQGADQDLVLALFDTLGKGIRTGPFLLPSAGGAS